MYYFSHIIYLIFLKRIHLYLKKVNKILFNPHNMSKLQYKKEYLLLINNYLNL
jgi:hypothetical protein